MAGRLLDIPSDVPGKEIASAWAWPTAKSPTLTPVGSPSGSQSRSGDPQPTCSDKTMLVDRPHFDVAAPGWVSPDESSVGTCACAAEGGRGQRWLAAVGGSFGGLGWGLRA
jgi:hypothetical protein